MRLRNDSGILRHVLPTICSQTHHAVISYFTRCSLDHDGVSNQRCFTLVPATFHDVSDAYCVLLVWYVCSFDVDFAILNPCWIVLGICKEYSLNCSIILHTERVRRVLHRINMRVPVQVISVYQILAFCAPFSVFWASCSVKHRLPFTCAHCSQ